MRECRRCKEQKPEEGFYVTHVGGKRENICKPCRVLYQRELYRKNIRKRQNYDLLTRYGITIEQYEEMFERQEGACAICRKPPGRRRLNVDHNHETGEVRGLLCDRCNLGLGFWQDHDWSLGVMAYLQACPVVRFTPEGV